MNFNKEGNNKNRVRPAGRTLKNPHTISKTGSSPAGTSCFSLVA